MPTLSANFMRDWQPERLRANLDRIPNPHPGYGPRELPRALVSLARHIERHGGRELLPVLADALEDVGYRQNCRSGRIIWQLRQTRADLRASTEMIRDLLASILGDSSVPPFRDTTPRRRIVRGGLNA